MTFNEYQEKAITTLTVHEGGEVNLIAYLTLGLVGESGEIAEKVKKIIRNEGGDFSKLDRADIQKELGDVLWYLSALARTLDLELGDVAQTNLTKLFDRKARGVIKSTGDNR
jgi:NTP pyrophosphatase (non-canonical NTP hydrolase)